MKFHQPFPRLCILQAVMMVFLSILSSASPKKHPNIILVMADDQGWGQTSYNGHPYLKTPHLTSMRWKLVSYKGGEWELYDLSVDRTEANILAVRLPERVEQIKKQYNTWEEQCKSGL